MVTGAGKSFALNTVKFKRYSVDGPDGRGLWEAVQGALCWRDCANLRGIRDGPQAGYGEPVLNSSSPRAGCFPDLVTDNYQRQCAISGERTLPALDAAHIMPTLPKVGRRGLNGVLMRRDIHSLFDLGYVTISPDMKFEVSKKIREEYENGRHYYALHGTGIQLPTDVTRWPRSISVDLALTQNGI